MKVPQIIKDLLSKYRPVSQQELNDMIALWQAGIDQEYYMTEIMYSQMKMIYKSILKFVRDEERIEDCVGVAILGLESALKGFDITKNAAFVKYMTLWVDARIRIHLRTDVTVFGGWKNKMNEKTGKMNSWNLVQCISLTTRADNGDDNDEDYDYANKVAYEIATQTGFDATDLIDPNYKENRYGAYIDEYLATLDPEDRKLLEMNYGLNEHPDYNIKSISEITGKNRKELKNDLKRLEQGLKEKILGESEYYQEYEDKKLNRSSEEITLSKVAKEFQMPIREYIENSKKRNIKVAIFEKSKFIGFKSIEEDVKNEIKTFDEAQIEYIQNRSCSIVENLTEDEKIANYQLF